MRQKSNVAALSVTSDKPPLGQILTPAQGTTYFGGMAINYSGSASDKEDGTLPVSAFTWRVDFHHDSHVHPFIPPAVKQALSPFQIEGKYLPMYIIT